MERILWLLVIYFVCPTICYRNSIDTFEFGVDVGRVSFSKSGKIGLTEKDVKIPIVLPHCSELTYVRVDVDNKIGPPHVTFDYDISTVNIKYRSLQYSKSSYVVTAKSVSGGNCQ